MRHMLLSGAALQRCDGRFENHWGFSSRGNMKCYKSIAALIIIMAGITLLATPAHAQSCALCYTQAASSGARMIQALKSGILVLIAPPTFMTVGVIFVCYRKRNQTRKDDAEESGNDWNNPS